MIRLYEKHPQIKGTINFVPSLIQQLIEYEEDKLSDDFLDHTIIPAAKLNAKQKLFILTYFFMANYETMIKPFPKYWEFLIRRGLNPETTNMDEAIRFFTEQEYLDIQVFYNLTWFGFAAREEYPEINELLSQGGKFTEDNKNTVIELQKKILNSLLTALRNLKDSQQIELSTTPYFHPILPLLIDTRSAKRASPNISLPHVLQAPELADYQIKKATKFMDNFVEKKVVGMWPSEGSVSPEIIPILARHNIGWVATDEAILYASKTSNDNKKNIYEPYIAQHEGSSIPIVFRNRELSDLIGFSYYRMTPDEAVEDFIKRINKISLREKDAKELLVTIILDGENPWEHYEESGKKFLLKLFNRIEHDKIQTTCISDFILKNPPQKTIDKLHSGSWINANFNIWIGKPQKNKAWNYLKLTLDEIEDKFNASNPDAQSAKDSFSAACGSDWFWWFDDDFSSQLKSEFDKIFRTHLKNAFTFLKRNIPLYLFDPIYEYDNNINSMLIPPAFIYPKIGGNTPTFFDWSNAVKINLHQAGTSMGQSEQLFEAFYFGFNEQAFFLRIDPVDHKKGFLLKDNEMIILYIISENKENRFRLFKKDDEYHFIACEETSNLICDKEYKISYGLGKVLEISFPYKPLGVKINDQLTLIITIVKDGIETRRYSHIKFIVPDENYELKMWSV